MQPFQECYSISRMILYIWRGHTLVNRIASLVEEGNPPASIIAFTFIEKAAAELKSRAVQRIREIKGEGKQNRGKPSLADHTRVSIG